MAGSADLHAGRRATAFLPRLDASATDVAVVLLAAILAALLQLPHPALPDVGWLVLCAERILGGEALYTEVVEVNPPMSVFIYMPVVLLRAATGLGLVAAVLALMAALSLLSITLASRILREAKLLADNWRWPAAAAFVLLVAPLGAFGQREHVAAVAVLPFLAAVAARAEAARIGVAVAVLAGLCGGLGMSIKPHFVLSGALPVLYALARTRSLRALAGPENWAAGLVLVLYAGLIWFRYPVFLETWIPILQDTYRAVRKPVFHLLTDPASLGLVAALGGAALAMGRTALAPRPAVSGLAAFGFLAAALEQGKLWNNHLYPALAFLLLIALADFRPALHRGGTGAERLAGGLGLALVVAGCVAGLSAMAFRPATTVAFAPTIRALGPDRPRLFALSGSIAAGNPLAAQVNAEWTGAPFGQWLFQFSDHRLTTEKLDPATRQRLQRFAERDRDYARAAIVNGRPDFILVDRATYDWRNWALGDPALSGALGDYTPVEQSSGVELWARRELAAGRTGPAGH